MIPVLLSIDCSVIPEESESDKLTETTQKPPPDFVFNHFFVSGHVLVPPTLGALLVLDVSPYIREKRRQDGRAIMYNWVLRYCGPIPPMENLNMKRFEATLRVDKGDLPSFLEEMYGGNVGELCDDLLACLQDAGFRIAKSPREEGEESDKLLGYSIQEESENLPAEPENTTSDGDPGSNSIH